ncbi:hypothetical protein F5Y14DRAFT_288839 [Nemania sp. NC0429]|nr:hypothetical protein F5Y14DRAFT_288839 [Nemania sp. NC0429]
MLSWRYISVCLPACLCRLSSSVYRRERERERRQNLGLGKVIYSLTTRVDSISTCEPCPFQEPSELVAQAPSPPRNDGTGWITTCDHDLLCSINHSFVNKDLTYYLSSATLSFVTSITCRRPLSMRQARQSSPHHAER